MDGFPERGYTVAGTVPDSDRIPFWVKPERDKQPDTGPFSVGGRLRIPTSKRKALKNCSVSGAGSFDGDDCRSGKITSRS